VRLYLCEQLLFRNDNNEVVIMVGWLEIGKFLLVLVGIFALIMFAPKWFFPKNGLRLG